MIAIRAATRADAPAIALLEPDWTEASVAATLDAPATVALVAVDGAIVGHVMSSVAADTAEILRIAVQPARRRQHIGHALLDAIDAAWVARGVRGAFLEVRADNEAAIALYRGHGWVDAGVRRRYYRDGSDAVVMSTTPGGTRRSS